MVLEKLSCIESEDYGCQVKYKLNIDLLDFACSMFNLEGYFLRVVDISNNINGVECSNLIFNQKDLEEQIKKGNITSVDFYLVDDRFKENGDLVHILVVNGVVEITAEDFDTIVDIEYKLGNEPQ